MSPFDEDPSENRSELELCIDEIHQLQARLTIANAENQQFRFGIGVALALEDIEAIKGTLRNC